MSIETAAPPEDRSLGNHLAAEQTSSRFTWYTIVLVGIFVLLALSTRGIPRQNAPTFRVAGKVFVLIVQWLMFFLAYKGIRASRSSLVDIVGKQWPSLQEFWKDLRLALTVVLLVWIAAYFVTHFAIYHSRLARPKTIPQYFLMLLVAVSAGFTEEIIFRGLLLRQFHLVTRNMIAAVAGQSLVFALAHGGNQSLAEFLKHCFSGCLFAGLALSRKSLLPAILAHVLVDVMAVTVLFLTR